MQNGCGLGCGFGAGLVPETNFENLGSRGGWKLRNKSAIFAVSAVRPP